jgi:hypothetical protein
MAHVTVGSAGVAMRANTLTPRVNCAHPMVMQLQTTTTEPIVCDVRPTAATIHKRARVSVTTTGRATDVRWKRVDVPYTVYADNSDVCVPTAMRVWRATSMNVPPAAHNTADVMCARGSACVSADGMAEIVNWVCAQNYYARVRMALADACGPDGRCSGHGQCRGENATVYACTCDSDRTGAYCQLARELQCDDGLDNDSG